MKFVYLIFFTLILSCSTVKKEYVCGDHPCVDKKEFNEFFSKNFIVEIKPQKKKNIKQNDLVRLNTESLNSKKNDNKYDKINRKIKAKKDKEELKKEKKRLLTERKNKKIEEKNKALERKKIAKYSKSKSKNKNLTTSKVDQKETTSLIYSKKTSDEKKSIVEISKSNISVNTDKIKNVKSICAEIKDCDINEIADLLIKKGKNKPYPNITYN